MTDQKKKVIDEREHEVEKYKFIKEQILPQRRKSVLKVVRKFFVTIMLAVVFGAVSAIVFYFVSDNISDKDERSAEASDNSVLEEYSTQNPDLSATPFPKTGSDVELPKINKSDTESIYDYSKLNRRIASIGETYKYSLATVSGYKRNDVLNSIIGVSNSHASYGVLVQEDNSAYYLVTKAEAVANTKAIEVEFYNGDISKAELVASDTNIGLAVVSVKKEKLNASTISNVVLASYASINSNLSVGSKVIAVGAPNGVMYSVMIGDITKSQIRASVTDNEIKLMSTDIPRSSKTNGIVLNTRGRIVGFITDSFGNIIGDTVVGFIELSSVQDIIRYMIDGKNVPYLGIEGCDVDSRTAKQHNISEGVYVTSVYSNSPAYSAGLRVADVITKVDGKRIISINQIHNALMGLNQGDKMKLTIERQNNKKTINKKIHVVLQ